MHNDHIDVVRMLVKEFGVDVAVAYDEGRTALHVAASEGHSEAVRVLVSDQR